MKILKGEYTIDRTIKLFINIILVALVILVMNRLSSVLLPFVIALTLAYLLNPLVNFFQKSVRGNRSIALAMTFILIILLHIIFYAYLIPNVIHEYERFSEIILKNKNQLFTWGFIPVNIKVWLNSFIQSEEFQQLLSLETLWPMAQKVLPGLWASFTDLFGLFASLFGVVAIMLYLVFILKDFSDFEQNWANYLPPNVRPEIERFVGSFNKNMLGYFRQKSIIVLINIVLFGIGFSILGMPLAIPLAILVGMLNYIPYLQNLGVLPCLLSVGLLSLETGQQYWILALIVLAIFLLVQLLEDAVLVPRLMQKVTGLHPAIMLLSLAVWGSLLGILGMIIALPITSVLITYYKDYVLQAPENEELAIDE